MRHWVLVAALGAVVVVGRGPAHAAAPQAATGATVASEAKGYFDRGKWEMAAELYRRAFELDRSRPEYLYGVGRAEQENGKLEPARIAFDQLLALLPNTNPLYAKCKIRMAELAAAWVGKAGQSLAANRGADAADALDRARVCDAVRAVAEAKARAVGALAEAWIAAWQAKLADSDPLHPALGSVAPQPAKPAPVVVGPPPPRPVTPEVVVPASKPAVALPIATTPVVEVAVEAPRPWQRSVALGCFGMAGAGLVAAVAGAVLAKRATDELDSFRDPTDARYFTDKLGPDDAVARQRGINSWWATAGIGAGVAVVGAGAGAWMWASARWAKTVVVVPTGDGAMLVGRF